MASGRSRGLPIFRDDLTFHDRHERAFEDMQRRFDDDFGRVGGAFGRRGRGGESWNWRDDLDKLCADFYELKPRAAGPRPDGLDDSGSRESLDDDGGGGGGAARRLYVEHPQTKSRTFHMSFDVKDYNPGDIAVKCDGGSLVITARHEDDAGGHVSVREFSRTIKIPSDVDPDKLTSTLSNDGILTVHAPVPPTYTSVAYVNPTAPPSGSGASGAGCGRRPAAGGQPTQAAPASQTYRRQPEATGTGESPAPGGRSEIRTSPQASGLDGSSSAGGADGKQPAEPPPLFEHSQSINIPLDTPTYGDAPDGSGRLFELALDIPRPFTPDDVVVKLDGRSLKVEATHDERSQGKTSTSSMTRSFDLTEDLDPGSVDAMLRSDGCLLIKGRVKPAT